MHSDTASSHTDLVGEPRDPSRHLQQRYWHPTVPRQCHLCHPSSNRRRPNGFGHVPHFGDARHEHLYNHHLFRAAVNPADALISIEGDLTSDPGVHAGSAPPWPPAPMELFEIQWPADLGCSWVPLTLTSCLTLRAVRSLGVHTSAPNVARLDNFTVTQYMLSGTSAVRGTGRLPGTCKTFGALAA